MPSRHAAVALLSLLLCHAAPAGLISYSFPEELPLSEDLTAYVAGTQVPAIQTKRGAFLSFGMSGPVEIEVYFEAPPEEVVIRPLSAGIQPKMDGAILRFTLPRPMNLSVEFDGNLANPLFIFANPGITDAPDRNDPKVRFFEGGKIHDVGKIEIGDGETVYLEGGAVVRGIVRATGNYVAVRGPGILDGGIRDHKTNILVVRDAFGARLEHFILLDPLGWSIHLSGSRDVRVHNTRVIGWRANSDGLDIEYSSNVNVDGCFWRTNDDCIAIKAIYPPGLEGVPLEEMADPEKLGGHAVERRVGDVMGDIHIRNCVLWNDQGGQGFEIGFELRVDTIRNISFRDSDIIHVVGGGAFTIHNGDRARIEDLLIDNIRVENAERLIDFHVGLSIYSDDCPPEFRRSNPQRVPPPDGHRPAAANNPWQWFVPAREDIAKYEENRGYVRNVVIRDVKVATPLRKGSILYGYSENRGIHNLLVSGLEIEGRPVASAGDLDLFTSDAYDIRFSGKETGRLTDPPLRTHPALPRVLVIGDSISMNYHDAARDALKGVADYQRIEGNSSSSAFGVVNVAQWLGNHTEPGLHWDVIQFNHGLHDLKQTYDKNTDTFGEYSVSLEDYQRNLETIITTLKKTGATLVWCSTTPVPNHNKGQYARRQGADEEFNRAALEVMSRHPDILVNDLHHTVTSSPIFDEWRKGNDVHFYRAEEQIALGQAVAIAMGKALAARNGE